MNHNFVPVVIFGLILIHSFKYSVILIVIVSASSQSLEELYDEPNYLELMKEGKMTSALAKQKSDDEEDIYDPEHYQEKESPKSSKGSPKGSRQGSGKGKKIRMGSAASLKSSRKSDGPEREPSEENIIIQDQGEGDLKDSTESEIKGRGGSAKRSSSGSRTSTPQYLSVPEQDIKPDRMILSSDEAMVDLRKRDREALKNASRIGVSVHAYFYTFNGGKDLA